jgi:hypothetical protein
MVDDSTSSATYSRKDLSVECTIGPPYQLGTRSFAWGKVRLEFATEADLPDSIIDIRVPIAYVPDMTARELQEATAAAARALLIGAIADLGEADGAAMLQFSAEFGNPQA